MKPQSIRWGSFLIALVFALPLPLGIFAGFYLWLSPYLFLNSTLALHHMVLFQVLAIVVLVTAIWKHRIFCHWVCPTGALCDAVSRRGCSNHLRHDFPAIHKTLCIFGLILAVFGVPVLILLDPINLFYAFCDAFYGLTLPILLLKISGLGIVLAISFLIPHIWCRRLCPLGGLQDLLYDGKRWMLEKRDKVKLPFDRKRRLCVEGIIAAGSIFALKKLSHAKSEPVIRPPGSQPEAFFKTLCARCGNCMKACPADIIVPSLRADDVLAALTPQIRFQDTYCPPDCTRCGEVCPSGAIAAFSADEKKHLVIGLAEINRPECLLSKNKECDLCKTYCPYDAIAIRESEFDFSSYPEVMAEQCVGCGACEIVCPVHVIEIAAVVQRTYL